MTFPKLEGELTPKGGGNCDDIPPSHLTISHVLYLIAYMSYVPCPTLPRDAAASLRESR